MSRGAERSAASENLLQTYFALGLAIPGASREAHEGFETCVGGFEHAICNFAVRLDLDPWSARRLCAFAQTRPAFNVYLLPDDRPTTSAEILERAGFRPVYRLMRMEAEVFDPGPVLELTRALDPRERLQVSEFMGEQFFPRQTSAFRRKVAEATAGASELELVSVMDKGQRIAAAMLCHHAGILGLYNLCVSPSRRGRGIGGAVVNAILTQAGEAGRRVTLQCDTRLEPWYRSLGFQRTGTIEVFALAKRISADIIG